MCLLLIFYLQLAFKREREFLAIYCVVSGGKSHQWKTLIDIIWKYLVI